MRTRNWTCLTALLGALGYAATALADDAVPPQAAEAAKPLPADARVAVVPERREWVEVAEPVPAVTSETKVPVYEDVVVPVYETRQVPDLRDVDVPTYATHEVPVFEDRQIPVNGPVEAPVYEKRRVPVTVTLWNPLKCFEEFDLELWDRCKEVRVGTEVREGVVGHRTERVQVGTRTESVQTGTETRQVVAGYRTERIQTGERTERRITGWRTEPIVVRPAEMRTVRRYVCVPARAVTLTAAEDPTAFRPLPGTSEVMSEEDYRRLVAAR
jgi:hypothetical protein